MATIFTHALVVLTAGRISGQQRRIVVCGVALALLPDVDVAGLPFGIPHEDLFGHRGFTHSLVFALATAAIATWVILRGSQFRAAAWRNTLIFLFACAASHGLLDAMTNGGSGIAFFSPFSNTRYFLPWRPLEVSPIGRDFFSSEGLDTLASEARWLWLPCAGAWLGSRLVRWRRSNGRR